MKNIFGAAVLAVGLSVSASANAWGDREQGVLAGAAGLWVIQQLQKVDENNQEGQTKQEQPAPTIIYTQPRPQTQYCETATVVDQFGYKRIINYCYFH